MRLNVLVLVCVFALLAVFYGRQLSTAQRAQGMPAGVSARKAVAPIPKTTKQIQPATAPQPPVAAEKPAPTTAAPAPEKKAPAATNTPPIAETKPPAAGDKTPVPTTNAPSPENKPPAPDNKPQVAENTPPPPVSMPPVVVAQPPVPQPKPTTRPTPPPPKVVAKPSAAASEKVALSISALKQIAQALQNYFRDTKRYPTELRELTPKYLGAVPLDPCTSRPYYYIPVNTPATAYILTTGRYPAGSLCRSVSPGLSYTTETGIQNSP